MQLNKIIVSILMLFTCALVLMPKAFGKEKKETITTNGKAYWVVTYTLTGSKKLFISSVFTNDCNHCCNEIREAFKKHLVMKDYDRNASTVAMSCLQDVKESTLEERRDSEIYKRKQQGYTVTEVNFSY
jgi:hypothetical protein